MAPACTKAREGVGEFRTVAIGRGAMLDAILPPLAFLVISLVKDSRTSMLAALFTAGALTA